MGEETGDGSPSSYTRIQTCHFSASGVKRMVKSPSLLIHAESGYSADAYWLQKVFLDLRVPVHLTNEDEMENRAQPLTWNKILSPPWLFSLEGHCLSWTMEKTYPPHFVKQMNEFLRKQTAQLVGPEYCAWFYGWEITTTPGTERKGSTRRDKLFHICTSSSAVDGLSWLQKRHITPQRCCFRRCWVSCERVGSFNFYFIRQNKMDRPIRCRAFNFQVLFYNGRLLVILVDAEVKTILEIFLPHGKEPHFMQATRLIIAQFCCKLVSVVLSSP